MNPAKATKAICVRTKGRKRNGSRNFLAGMFFSRTRILSNIMKTGCDTCWLWSNGVGKCRQEGASSQSLQEGCEFTFASSAFCPYHRDQESVSLGKIYHYVLLFLKEEIGVITVQCFHFVQQISNGIRVGNVGLRDWGK